jgi:hypothetical protein
MDQIQLHSAYLLLGAAAEAELMGHPLQPVLGALEAEPVITTALGLLTVLGLLGKGTQEELLLEHMGLQIIPLQVAVAPEQSVETCHRRLLAEQVVLGYRRRSPEMLYITLVVAAVQHTLVVHRAQAGAVVVALVEVQQGPYRELLIQVAVAVGFVMVMEGPQAVPGSLLFPIKTQVSVPSEVM